jgi:hypothetical protein
MNNTNLTNASAAPYAEGGWRGRLAVVVGLDNRWIIYSTVFIR